MRKESTRVHVTGVKSTVMNKYANSVTWKFCYMEIPHHDNFVTSKYTLRVMSTHRHILRIILASKHALIVFLASKHALRVSLQIRLHVNYVPCIETRNKSVLANSVA